MKRKKSYTFTNFINARNTLGNIGYKLDRIDTKLNEYHFIDKNNVIVNVKKYNDGKFKCLALIPYSINLKAISLN